MTLLIEMPLAVLILVPFRHLRAAAFVLQTTLQVRCRGRGLEEVRLCVCTWGSGRIGCPPPFCCWWR